jgi:hypothetical protein
MAGYFRELTNKVPVKQNTKIVVGYIQPSVQFVLSRCTAVAHRIQYAIH